MTYVLHYTSADGPGEDATWSVYREEYESIAAEEPIEGSQVKVSTHPSEDEADTRAIRLQRESYREGSNEQEQA